MTLHARHFFLLLAPLIVAGSAVPALAQQDTYTPTQKPARTLPGTNPAQTPKKDLREEGREVFGKPATPGAESPEVTYWSILIHAYHPGEEADARDGLARVQGEGGLPKAYLEKRGEATVIAYGQYDDPSSKAALADLAKVRGIQVVIQGQTVKPFGTAFLAPPAEIKGSIPEYDLRNARKSNGDWVLYTLEIGFYGRGDRKPGTPAEMEEFRRTAEKAAIDLRRQGEQAFYYHGPQYSSVTIGLFGKDDFDSETHVDSPTLHALRQRFPYDLQNGMGIKQRVKLTDANGHIVKAEAMQPSHLVNVPKD